MLDDAVGLGNLAQGLALVAVLASRRFVRWLSQTTHPRRLLQPVARWRLAAVRTVQSEPPLQFGDPRLQRRHLGRVALLLRQQQCNQLGVRKLPERGSIHAIQEPTRQTRVNHNLCRSHPHLANSRPAPSVSARKSGCLPGQLPSIIIGGSWPILMIMRRAGSGGRAGRSRRDRTYCASPF
jgi:hypothetical protein